MTEQDLLRDCLIRLNASALSYMLVGSMASNFWGIPRSTHDLDFVLQYRETDVPRIVALFEDDFFIQETSVRSALRAPFQFNAIDNRSALKVDFWKLRDESFEQEMFRRRRFQRVLETDGWIAMPEDVILHKFLWHRISPSQRQLDDIAGVWLVSNELLDLKYMQQWAAELGVLDLLDELQTGKLNPKST